MNSLYETRDYVSGWSCGYSISHIRDKIDSHSFSDISVQLFKFLISSLSEQERLIGCEPVVAKIAFKHKKKNNRSKKKKKVNNNVHHTRK